MNRIRGISSLKSFKISLSLPLQFGHYSFVHTSHIQVAHNTFDLLWHVFRQSLSLEKFVFFKSYISTIISFIISSEKIVPKGLFADCLQYSTYSSKLYYVYWWYIYIQQHLQLFGNNINWFILFGFLQLSCTIFLLYRYIFKIIKIIHTFINSSNMIVFQIIGNEFLFCINI